MTRLGACRTILGFQLPRLVVATSIFFNFFREKKAHKKVIIVKYFNHCCVQCAKKEQSICNIVSDLSYDDICYVHGLTLQQPFNMMEQATRDAPNREHLLQPLQTRVRFGSSSTPSRIQNYAEKLTVIFNALCAAHPNGSTLNIVGNDSRFVTLSIQGFVAHH